MNKRLRKKKRIGEYKEYGFCICAIVPCLEKASDIYVDKFCDEFVSFVESINRGVGGGIGYNTNVFCMALGRGSCTEDDRVAIDGFLSNHPLVSKFKVGPLVDAWHGSYKDFELELD